MQKKYSINPLIILTLAILLNGFSVHAQSCNSKLNVFKNRDARSATINDPTKFKLELTNNSTRSQSYEIRSVIFDEPCEDVGVSKTNTKRSSDLNVSIVSNNSRSNLVTVPAGSTLSFIAEVSVNPGTKLNTWKCVELVAVSDACSSRDTRKLLKVYISDPSEH